MYCNYFKPAFDYLFSFIGLVILSPIFIFLAIAIKIDSPGPVFFLQDRLGKKGKMFKIIKFRSMKTDIKHKTFETLSTDPRITKVGKFIRKTSLDETPQLINILKGDMSFIGPRPPLPNFPRRFSEYNEFEKKRFDVKPGISGLAAIKQREIHDWDLNIPLDVEYAENVSAILDIELFFSSLLAFFRTNNIYSK